jgi:hypothetical protein
MKRYFEKRRAQQISAPKEKRLLNELRRLLSDEKNSVAFDLRSADKPVWLIYADDELRQKNILANAQIIAVKGTVFAIQAKD